MIPAAGKAVLITGCDTGFGHMAALELDKLGYIVFATCLTESGAQNLKAKATSNMHTVVCDLTKSESIAATLNTVTADLKGQGLHALVNNAGLMLGKHVETCPMSTYRLNMEVNYFGLVAITKAFAPLLRLARGRVINLSSVAGRISPSGLSAYCASKYAVEAFSDSLRRELGWFGVQVTMIEPGFCRTGLLTAYAESVAKEWAAASAEVRDLYGDEYIQKDSSKFQEYASKATNPAEVVSAVVDAVRLETLKDRYPVGSDAKSQWVPLSRYPAWLQDYLFRKVAGKNRPQKAVVALA